MKKEFLLLEDVDGVGRKGAIVTVAPGLAKNFLLPKKLATVADKAALNQRARLQKEREEQAIRDRAEAEATAHKLETLSLSFTMKVDDQGAMYGSVSVKEILEQLEHNGIVVERNAIKLKHGIKEIGEHRIPLSLKEGVEAMVSLTIDPEND